MSYDFADYDELEAQEMAEKYGRENMNNPIPSPGDIIYTSRGLYKHFGVYVGSGQVIHFAGPKGHEINASMADIIKNSIPDFLKGGKLFIQPDRTRNPLPADEIIRRAESAVGKCKGEYNLVINNCEHFANWCRYGKPVSKQVDTAITIASAVGTFALIVFSSWLHSKAEKDKSSELV